MTNFSDTMASIADFYGINDLFKRPTNQPSSILTSPPNSRGATLEGLRLNYRYTQNVSEEHLKTIQELVSDEDSRHSSIETKISNVVTQAGLVFSITAVIAPFFNDTINGQSLGVKILVLFFFVLAFLAYVVSILFATQIFGVNKFIYIKTSPASVIDSGATYEDVISKRVRDLIFQHGENKVVNNKKASILIYANRWFVSGFVLSGLLTGIITVSLVFVDKPNEREKELVQLLKSLDIRLHNAESILTQQQFMALAAQDSVTGRNIKRIFQSNKATFDSIRHEFVKLKTQIRK
ncbi:hypothetical protein [Dyadobacter psychrotolerans]|uniref:Uncharacterized protein n=1 Tax=Dyadobacter psychrotolerans TaxID=2541721 RepID=A0A4R5D9T4_9BACT|nr:hypothetical protein [Dyadobacter psychrotolerans]TDE08700.1 hypothetical protein E0F88_32235 [Dyadobacter psychrotolerans]